MSWEVIVTPTAEKHLSAISDQRLQQVITGCIESLESNPEKKGKPLIGSLAGRRSIRTPGQRYRIIYRVDTNQRRVYILALGIRKEGDKRDVYALARKLAKAGLLVLLLLLITFDVS